MRYPTFDNDNPLDAALSYVTRCLQQIPNFDVIETINIELNSNFIAESPSWKHLDAVLADIHTHGSLKSVVIHPMPPPVWLPHCAVLEARVSYVILSEGTTKVHSHINRRLRARLTKAGPKTLDLHPLQCVLGTLTWRARTLQLQRETTYISPRLSTIVK